MERRRPQLAELFMARNDELLAVLARDAGQALRTCECAVAPTELASVYQALFVHRYMAGRSVKLGRAGTRIGGGRSFTVAYVSRSFIAHPQDAEISVAIDR